MNECPKCHSQEIEENDMAKQTNGKSIEYFTSDEPDEYRCKKCDFTWPVKK